MDEVGMTRIVIPSIGWAVALLLSMTTGFALGGEPLAPNYAHRSLSRHEFGSGSKSYYLYEPADPKPDKAPVIVFLHGWLAVNPGVYGAWIEHLVYQGNIVIFPRYQSDWTTRPAHFLSNAQAIHVLRTSPAHVKPDLDKFALIGHSAGANISVLMAASAAEVGLPVPKAIIALTPGEVQSVPGPDLAKIPGEALLVVIAADADVVVGDGRARQIFVEALAVPATRKKFVLIRSDRRGVPWLIADHFAPTAGSARLDNGDGPFRAVQMQRAEINALDRAGFWRIADITFEAAFRGKTLDEVTEQGAAFRTLGFWSDGHAVLAPYVSDDLALIPRVLPPHGIRLIPWTSTELLMEKMGLADRRLSEVP
jgi:acetyl esterase/lipase